MFWGSRTSSYYVDTSWLKLAFHVAFVFLIFPPTHNLILWGIILLLLVIYLSFSHVDRHALPISSAKIAVIGLPSLHLTWKISNCHFLASLLRSINF